MEKEIEKFLQAEESVERLIETLGKLQNEVKSYQGATNELEVVGDKLLELTRLTKDFANNSYEVIKTLKDIGSPEIFERFTKLENNLEENLKSIENSLEERSTKIQNQIDESIKSTENSLNERFTKLENKLEENSKSIEKNIGEKFTKIENKIEEAFNKQSSGIKNTKTFLIILLLTSLATIGLLVYPLIR